MRAAIVQGKIIETPKNQGESKEVVTRAKELGFHVKSRPVSIIDVAEKLLIKSWQRKKEHEKKYGEVAAKTTAVAEKRSSACQKKDNWDNQ